MSENNRTKDIILDGNKVIDQTGKALSTLMHIIFPKRYPDAKKRDAQLHMDLQEIYAGRAQYKDGALIQYGTGLILEDAANLTNTLEATSFKIKNIEDVAQKEQNIGFLDAWKSIVRNISTKELQDTFANLLARELENPNSISIRTLKCVESMSVNEATAFINAAKFIAPNDSLILHPEVNERVLVEHTQMHSLVDAGIIINYTPGLFRGSQLYKTTIDEKTEIFYLIICNYIFYFLETECKNGSTPSMTYWQITDSAKQLHRATQSNELSAQEAKEIGCVLLSKNKDKAKRLFCKKITTVGKSHNILDEGMILITDETISNLLATLE